MNMEPEHQATLSGGGGRAPICTYHKEMRPQMGIGCGRKGRCRLWPTSVLPHQYLNDGSASRPSQLLLRPNLNNILM